MNEYLTQNTHSSFKIVTCILPIFQLHLPFVKIFFGKWFIVLRTFSLLTMMSLLLLGNTLLLVDYGSLMMIHIKRVRCESTYRVHGLRSRSLCKLDWWWSCHKPWCSCNWYKSLSNKLSTRRETQTEKQNKT